MGCTLFLFPGGREFQRRSREQQGQPEYRAGSKRAPLPATGQLMGPPACASPFSMACTALRQLGPNTASDHLALTLQHCSHLPQALQDPSGIPRKEPVPFSSLIRSRTIDRANPCSYLARPSSPVSQHNHVTSTRTLCPAF